MTMYAIESLTRLNVSFVPQGTFKWRFLFWATSKNPEISEILGIRILKCRKNPERKILRIPKSRGSGTGFLNLAKILRKSRKNPENPGDRERDF